MENRKVEQSLGFRKMQGQVTLSNTCVETRLEVPALDPAKLTVSAFLKNHTNLPMNGELIGRIERIDFSQKVTLRGQGEHTVHVLADFVALEALARLRNDYLASRAVNAKVAQ